MKQSDIEFIDVWQRMGENSTATFNYAPVGIVKIKTGRKYIYLIPIGCDYNCEGGHSIYQITQEEFDKQYSLTKLE